MPGGSTGFTWKQLSVQHDYVPSGVPTRKNVSCFEHDYLDALLDKFVGSGDARDAGPNDTDISLNVLFEHGELWPVLVRVSVNPYRVIGTGSLEEVRWVALCFCHVGVGPG